MFMLGVVGVHVIPPSVTRALPSLSTPLVGEASDRPIQVIMFWDVRCIKGSTPTKVPRSWRRRYGSVDRGGSWISFVLKPITKFHTKSYIDSMVNRRQLLPIICARHHDTVIE